MKQVNCALNSLDVTKQLFQYTYNPDHIAFVRKSLVLFDQIVFNVSDQMGDWHGMVEEIIGSNVPSKIQKHFKQSLLPIEKLKLPPKTYHEALNEIISKADSSKINEEKLRIYLDDYFRNERLGSNYPWDDPRHVPFQFNALSISREAGISYLPNERDYDEIKNLFTHGDTQLQQKELLRLAFPDINNISIENLYEMRNDPMISEFRTFIHSNSFNSPAEFQDMIESSLQKLLRGVRPAKDGDILIRIYNNLPMPFINPVTLLSDALEVKAEIERYKEYAWLFFMFEHK
jgi:hypothetical protein